MFSGDSDDDSYSAGYSNGENDAIRKICDFLNNRIIHNKEYCPQDIIDAINEEFGIKKENIK